MTPDGTGSGLAKLILCGEHAVVYGHPAVAIAVDLRTTVTLVRREGPLCAPSGDARLDRALRLSLGADGWEVGIESSIPRGKGMGSSAALGVALVRAAAEANGEDALSHEAVFDRALPIERVFHGNPSGLDVAISARGGAIRYRRGQPLEPLPLPAGHVVVLDTGRHGDTARMVAEVAARRPGNDPVLTRIGDLAGAAVDALDAPLRLGPLLLENHALLRQLGVSTPELDRCVALAMAHGAWGAKLAGAGGGGVVLALCPDPGAILRAAAREGIEARSCRLVEAA